MRNLPEWAVGFFAGSLLGAIVTPLNAWWTREELAFGLGNSGSKIVLCDVERFKRIEPIIETLSDIKKVYVTRALSLPDRSDVVPFERITGSPNHWSSLPVGSIPDVAIDTDDDSSIFYTSGTAGSPRGAVQSHRNAITAIIASQYTSDRSIVRRGDPLPPPIPANPPSLLLSVPLFHTTGCHIMLCPAMVIGTKIVLQHKFDAGKALALIEKERIARAGGVPTIAYQLLEHPDRTKYDLSSLRMIGYGGAPAPPELARRLKEAFPGAAPGFGWGMTETTSIFAGNRAEDFMARPESSGPCMPICDMKIVDNLGRDLPVGNVGELLVKGPNIIRGYWQNAEATAALFTDDGWLKTGDLARLDDEGFIYIVDRKKDMLIRGGENIYCIEVEDVLYQHPAVMDAGIIGLPHPSLGEEPVAVVVLKPGARASEREIREFIAARLAAFKVPVRIAISDDQLPRNANGKILKKQLRNYFI